MKNVNSDEVLKRQLSAWEVESEIPQRFQSDVWARIAASESGRRSLWEQFGEWFATEFCKPRLAATFVTLGLSVSIGIAYVRAQSSNEWYGRQLEQRYMETINPLSHGGHDS